MSNPTRKSRPRVEKAQIVPTDPQAKYPWEDMMRDYVEGWDNKGQTVYPTGTEIAQRYGVPANQVQNKMAKQRWKDHRQAHQAEVANERKKEAVKKMAGKAIKFDEDSLSVADAGMSVISNRIQFILDVQQAGLDPATMDNLKEKLARGEDLNMNDFRGVVYYKELEALAKAAASFQDVGRKALGIKDGENTFVNQVNVDVQQTNVAAEIARPDRDRVKGILSIITRENANLNLALPAGSSEPAVEENDDIPVAEIVEDEDNE